MKFHYFLLKKNKYFKTIIGDAKNYEKIGKLIIEKNYDYVINCIGILNQDAENNKELAVFINSFLPRYLEKITNNTKTQIIHISTDCVFSGKKGNYSEYDFKDGDNIYSRSKALGEIINHKDLTLRTSIIGPDLKKKGIGLFNWFMLNHEDMNGYKNAIWTGVSTITLAKAIYKATQTKLVGIYNLVNNKKISKYELLNLFLQHSKKNKIKIIPFNSHKVDKSLINNRKDFKFNIPEYNQMVKEIFEWIGKYKELYIHYKGAYNEKN